MRRSWKYGILLLLIIGGFWLVRLLFLRPFNIDHFFDRTFLLYALESPEYLSTTRILDQYGITSHRKHLDDISVQALDRAERFFKQTEATFRAYDRTALNESQALSYDIFEWHLRSLQNATGTWRFHNYPLNQMNGVQNYFPVFMQDVHTVESKAEARDYVARLYAVRDKFEQLLEGLKIRQQKGIVPPDFILDRVLDSMRSFVSVPYLENSLYQSFDEKLRAADAIEEKDKDIYRKGAEEAMRDAVYPAYAKLIAYAEDLRRTASHDAGVWKWPNGDAFYRYILAEHTTLDLEPEAVHQLGLAEVARIQQELRQMLEKQGISTGPSLSATLKALDQDPRFSYPNDESGREQILRDYQAIIDEAAQNLGAYFTAMPKASVTVERAPAFMEATAPSGSYQSPSLDGKRGGIFYANIGDIRNTKKYGMRTLAYHEAIPGHHLQVALNQEVKDLPYFRRDMNFTAFAEGWGLYAERLAFEAGLEKDPFDSIGRLRAELYRAARLVVDTGLHAKRWTRQQGIDFLQNEASLPEAQAQREVDRYVVAPGQACAYMIGMLKILELRNKAQTALGDKFDVKAFHQLVLEDGAMPLTILEQRVERWLTNLR
jgi:uncharacterized protein (DUF885 family)